MTTIYFAGGEDHDHYQVGGGIVDTGTAGSFRSTYSRCGLRINNTLDNTAYWQNYATWASTPSTFWFSTRMAANSGASAGSGTKFIVFCDSANIPRLRLTSTGSSIIIVQKLNTAGTATTLPNTLTPWTYVASGTNIADKIDIHWVNSVSGSIDIYFNLVHVYSYTGDTTTETTAIAYHRGGWIGGGANSWYSEFIVSDTDTRSFNLQTLAPVANGNTHNFDTGSPAAANVNEITLLDATLDGSTTAGQIDQYTIPALAAGTYTIFAVGISARMQKGTSGPSKMDLGVRQSGTDYWSSDFTLDNAWWNYQNWWVTDPSTSATWTSLPVNIGLKSVT